MVFCYFFTIPRVYDRAFSLRNIKKQPKIAGARIFFYILLMTYVNVYRVFLLAWFPKDTFYGREMIFFFFYLNIICGTYELFIYSFIKKDKKLFIQQ